MNSSQQKKNAHISEGKLKEILQLFCTDMNATQIAQASAVSRVTVNNYVKFFRVQIAKYCEEKKEILQPLNGHATTSMPQYFSDRYLLNEPLVPGVGVMLNGESLIADPISSISSRMLVEQLKKGVVDANSVMKMYSAFIDFEKKRMYRVQEGQLMKKAKQSADEIDFFWKLLKMRIVKMRGLQPSSLYLHIKETEFRYNNRNRELYDILLPMVTGARKSELN